MGAYLDNTLVVDFSQYYPGPFATTRLEQWGARVIKVESPQGDPSRVHEPIKDGFGLAYRVLNCGKASLCVDLKDSAQRAQIYELVKAAEVVVEGFRPGVATKLGIDYPTLKALNPQLVYCSISGYGQGSPLAQASGHDLNYLAISGVLSQFADGEGRPVLPKLALVDSVSGVVASEEICAALVRRYQTGEGGYLDISMTESVLLLQGLLAAELSETGRIAGPGNQLCYNLYQTSDGRWISVAALEEKFWIVFCEGIGHPELIAHQKSAASNDNPAYRKLVAAVREHDFAWWCAFSEAHDCCFAPVLQLGEVLVAPFVQERGVVVRTGGLTTLATHYSAGRAAFYETETHCEQVAPGKLAVSCKPETCYEQETPGKPVVPWRTLGQDNDLFNTAFT